MNKPIYLKTQQLISVPLNITWQTVAEGFGEVDLYNPEIKQSNIISENTSGLGAQRHCDFNGSGYIDEEIIRWEPKESFEIQFLKSSVPIGYLKSKFTFRENDEQTEITQEFWYRLKYPFGPISGLMKGKMLQTLNNGLTGLKNYLENQNKSDYGSK